MVKMSKIIYVDGKDKKYNFNIKEDTIIYHYNINSSYDVEINLDKEDIFLYYYYNNINYDDNTFKIRIYHNKDNTESFIYNHGVNVYDKKLHYWVDGVIPKDSVGCDCNQDNQIININDGKSKIWPNLLVDNYDVNANHSAYIGKFKESLIFYLMSRGINRKDSYKLLLNGFLINNDSIDKSKIKYFIDEIDKI